MSKAKAKPIIKYFVFIEGDDPYFEQFNSIEDAVDNHGRPQTGVAVFRAELKHIGAYKRSNKIERVKARKKKKK